MISKTMIDKIQQMFPKANLSQAVSQAEQQIRGKSPNDASKILKSAGITEGGINAIFEKHGNSLQAKAVLGMLGTTPEKIKSQALSMLGNNNNNNNNISNKSGKADSKSKFPRLK